MSFRLFLDPLNENFHPGETVQHENPKQLRQTKLQLLPQIYLDPNSVMFIILVSVSSLLVGKLFKTITTCKVTL